MAVVITDIGSIAKPMPEVKPSAEAEPKTDKRKKAKE